MHNTSCIILLGEPDIEIYSDTVDDKKINLEEGYESEGSFILINDIEGVPDSELINNYDDTKNINLLCYEELTGYVLIGV